MFKIMADMPEPQIIAVAGNEEMGKEMLEKMGWSIELDDLKDGFCNSYELYGEPFSLATEDYLKNDKGIHWLLVSDSKILLESADFTLIKRIAEGMGWHYHMNDAKVGRPVYLYVEKFFEHVPRMISKKILPEYFEAVCQDKKTFELRKDEDEIEVGNRLQLEEWDPEKEDYTGRTVTVDVTYVLRNTPEYGLMDGYCIIGFKK